MHGWQGVGCALGVGVVCEIGSGRKAWSEGAGIGLGAGAKWVTGTSGIEALAVQRWGHTSTPTITSAMKPTASFARRELIFTPGVVFIAASLPRSARNQGF